MPIRGVIDMKKFLAASVMLLFFAVLALATFVWLMSPVQAQTGFKIRVELGCNTTDVIIKMLKDKYREVTTGGGASNGGMVRLFESHDAGKKQTWTLVISSPDGYSCVMKGGENWMSDPEIVKGDPT